MMKPMIKMLAIVAALSFAGCSNMSPTGRNVLGGAAIGSIGGAVIGGGRGAIIGAGVGGAAGYLYSRSRYRGRGYYYY